MQLLLREAEGKRRYSDCTNGHPWGSAYLRKYPPSRFTQAIFPDNFPPYQLRFLHIRILEFA